MIDNVKIIQLAMESLNMNELSRLDDTTYTGLLHDLKNFVIDLQDVKHKVEELTDNERIERLEERTNVLKLENERLKFILENVCNRRHHPHKQKIRK